MKEKTDPIQNQANHDPDSKVYYVDMGDVPTEEVIEKLKSLYSTFPKKFNKKDKTNAK